MESEAPASLVEKVNVLEEKPKNRSCPGEKKQGKVPRRIHKAEREKMKREHLNELFLDLANVLELGEQNNGKASVLCEAARLLRDLLGEIESLKKENMSLLSESRYVSVEKNELKEENSALETQIRKLKGEIEARVAQSKPDLNVPPPLELQSPDQMTNFPVGGDGLRLPAMDPTLQQRPAVIVVPFSPQLQDAFPGHKPSSNISRPHARYPTAADSWPSQLLGEQPTSN